MSKFRIARARLFSRSGRKARGARPHVPHAPASPGCSTLMDRLEARMMFAGVAGGAVPWMADRPVLHESAVAAVSAVAPAVTSLTVINADTDQPIAQFDPFSGGTLDLAALGTKNLNIRANTNPATVGSVKFGYDANAAYRIENSAVYAFAGNNGNDYYAWTPTVGTHTVKATPYTGANAGGTAGTAVTVTFNVVNGGGSTLPAVSVSATDATASEGGDKGTFTITRTGSTTSSLTVNLSMGGTATNGTAGADYALVTSPVTIPAGSASVAVNINPVDDAAYEGSETAVLTLLSGSGYTVGAASATVTIADNDSAPTDPAQTPYATAFAVPSSTPIQAEDFDNGGEGVAYHDTDASNVTGSYRTNVGVDIEPSTDAGGGFAVGHIAAGEWLEYTVDVASAGSYDLGVRFASGSGGGAAHLEVDGTNVTGAISLPGTGGWQTWQTIGKGGINLTGGRHVLRLAFDTSTYGGDLGNLNWIQITPTPPPPPPAVAPAWPSSWLKVASAPSPRFEAAATVLGGKVYAFGGFKNSSFQVDRTYTCYDVATNKWANLGTMPVGMAETHLGIAEDGRYIYFAGGFGGDLNSSKTPSQWVSDKVWRYDPSNNSWLQIATLPQPRGAGTLDYLNGELHYIGGNPADRVTNLGDHFVYNLAAGTWRTAAPLPNPKDHLSSVALNGKIYALGGEHGHDQFHAQMADMHVYDPASNRWAQLTSMPMAKSHMEAGTFVSDGKIIMAGGQVDNFQSTNNVIAYDPNTNSWATLSPLPASRQGGVVRRVGNQIVVTLGAVYTNSPQSDTWVGQLPTA